MLSPSLPLALALAPALLLALSAAPPLAAAMKVPEIIKVCKQNDPKVSECITNSIEYLRPHLAKGIPELKVPALEPLVLRELTLTDNQQLHIVGKDIVAYGASTYQITDLDADLKKWVIRAHVVFPEGVSILGRYSVNGNILLLPIRGNGPFSLNITAAEADVDLRLKMEEQPDGESYLTMTGLDIVIDVKGGSVHLSNLFGGDRFLGDMVNTAVNANFPVVLREVKPSVEKALSSTFMELAQHIFSSAPVNDLFPPK